jgi:hypothetical protein
LGTLPNIQQHIFRYVEMPLTIGVADMDGLQLFAQAGDTIALAKLAVVAVVIVRTTRTGVIQRVHGRAAGAVVHCSGHSCNSTGDCRLRGKVRGAGEQ